MQLISESELEHACKLAAARRARLCVHLDFLGLADQVPTEECTVPPLGPNEKIVSTRHRQESTLTFGSCLRCSFAADMFVSSTDRPCIPPLHACQNSQARYESFSDFRGLKK